MTQIELHSAALDRGEPVEQASRGTLSLLALSTLVAGSMVGGGIFSLPQAFGRSTGALGAIIAWTIAGAGMLMLAFVFQTLSRRKPGLDAGIYAYAREGFGDYLGFLSAFGYWASACLGLVTFLVLAQSTLGAFFPLFGEGDTLAGMLCASVVLWAFHVMLLRGIKSATAINTIVTIAKIIPIVVFLVLVAFAARYDIFTSNFLGSENPSVATIFEQVRSTMLIVVFVFLGIEGASVYSRYARNREDVGYATLLGFLGVFALFALVTLLSYGILMRSQLAVLHNPSMAGVLEAVVGRAGAIFISIGVLVSVLGAFLSWSLLAAEVLWSAGRNGIMPSFLGRANAAGTPRAAIWLTSGAVQIFMVMTLYAESTLRLAIELTSIMSLIPYLLVAGYAVLIAWKGETYERNPEQRSSDLARGALALVYAAALILAGGLKLLLLSAVLYAPGTALFLIARREQGRRVFTALEMLVASVVVLAACIGLWALSTGSVTL